MDSDLDKETERLFQIVLDHADKFHATNPHLFADLAQGLPYEVLGNGMGGELEKVFETVLDGLYLKNRETLRQLRNRVGKDTAAYALVESIIYYQISLCSSSRD